MQLRSVSVTADLTIAVSRDADGTLAEGARARLAGTEAVRSVEAFDVTGVSPGLNDVEVDAAATVDVAVPADEDEAVAARRRMEDAFGVTVDAVEA